MSIAIKCVNQSRCLKDPRSAIRLPSCWPPIHQTSSPLLQAQTYRVSRHCSLTAYARRLIPLQVSQSSISSASGLVTTRRRFGAAGLGDAALCSRSITTDRFALSARVFLLATALFLLLLLAAFLTPNGAQMCGRMGAARDVATADLRISSSPIALIWESTFSCDAGDSSSSCSSCATIQKASHGLDELRLAAQNASNSPSGRLASCSLDSCATAAKALGDRTDAHRQGDGGSLRTVMSLSLSSA